MKQYLNQAVSKKQMEISFGVNELYGKYIWTLYAV